MPTGHSTPWYALEKRTRSLIAAAVLIIAIAAVDAVVVPSAGLGFLYFFPLILASAYLSRWQIASLALVCTALREMFAFLPPGPEKWPRFGFVYLAYAFVGLFVHEMVIYRRAALRHFSDLRREIGLRRRAEEQLEVLINSSPAGIITVGPDGRILLSNEASHQIFGVAPGALPGQPIRDFLPLLEDLQRSEGAVSYRTAVECHGRRANGEGFLAHVWLSTFDSDGGSALAAIVLDASEDFRDREETGLRQLLAGSRIMVGAVSHEIRNAVGAIAIVHANLGRIQGLAGNEDFKALGDLVEALRTIASSNIFLAAEPSEGVDLASVLDDFRILVAPAARDANCEIVYHTPAAMPRVRGHRQRLLQVFLNLAGNSFRALQDCAEKQLVITVALRDSDSVTVRFQDSGPGVLHPERLFSPFQEGADSSGLGLYISRAIVRSFAGDLRYDAAAAGACFVVELVTARAGAPVSNSAALP